MRLPVNENSEIGTANMNTQTSTSTTHSVQSLVEHSSVNSSAYTSQYTYHELADIPVQEVDVLQALENNMTQLNDIQNRMQFMMREIRYLMKV